MPFWWRFIWVLCDNRGIHHFRCQFTTRTDHFGVVKAFLDANLLPRVVSGTSAGGLIAAFVCCYREDELKALLVPELANRITACEEPFNVWFKRFWTTGVIGRHLRGKSRLTTVSRCQVRRFNMGEEGFGVILSGLARSNSEGQCTFFTRGSLTFREAYLRTGRILNISVIPADRHSYVPILLTRWGLHLNKH